MYPILRKNALKNANVQRKRQAGGPLGKRSPSVVSWAMRRQKKSDGHKSSNLMMTGRKIRAADAHCPKKMNTSIRMRIAHFSSALRL